MIELLTIAGAIVLASCLAGSMAMWVFGRLLPLAYTRRELSEEEARKLRADLRLGNVCADCKRPMAHAYGEGALCSYCEVDRIERGEREVA